MLCNKRELMSNVITVIKLIRYFFHLTFLNSKVLKAFRFYFMDLSFIDIIMQIRFKQFFETAQGVFLQIKFSINLAKDQSSSVATYQHLIVRQVIFEESGSYQKYTNVLFWNKTLEITYGINSPRSNIVATSFSVVKNHEFDLFI